MEFRAGFDLTSAIPVFLACCLTRMLTFLSELRARWGTLPAGFGGRFLVFNVY